MSPWLAGLAAGAAGGALRWLMGRLLRAPDPAGVLGGRAGPLLHLAHGALWGALFGRFGPGLGLGPFWGGLTLGGLLFVLEALLWRPRAAIHDYTWRGLALPLLLQAAAGLASAAALVLLGVRL